MLFSVHCCLEIKSNQNYLIPASTFINVLHAYLSQHTHYNIHTHPQSVEAYLFLPSCSLCSMGLCLLNYHQHFIWTNLPWTHTSFLLQHNNFKCLLNIKILNVYKTTSRCLNLCWWVFSCWWLLRIGSWHLCELHLLNFEPAFNPLNLNLGQPSSLSQTGIWTSLWLLSPLLWLTVTVTFSVVIWPRVK